MLGTKLLISAALLGITLLPMAAQAASPNHHPGSINARERRQDRRIEQGERRGSLTYRESQRLERRDARLERQEARMRRSGGKFTVAERERLQHEMNRNSRNIYRQKHDKQHVH